MAFSINAQEFDVEKALESATSIELKETYEKYKGVQQPVKLKKGSVIIGDLEWMRCSIGQKWENNTCTGVAKKFDWHEAHKIIEAFNSQAKFLGYSDWRLPNIKELSELRHCDSNKAKDTTYVKRTSWKEYSIQQPSSFVTFRHCAEHGSVINKKYFPNTPDDITVGFWSGTETYQQAYTVEFSFGFIREESISGQYAKKRYVRLVRKNNEVE